MHHQVTIVPGLEGESASQPAQCLAFLVLSVESKYDHAATIKPCRQDASRYSGTQSQLSATMMRKAVNHFATPRRQDAKAQGERESFFAAPRRAIRNLSAPEPPSCKSNLLEDNLPTS